jgi:hypothetical protein
MNACQLCSNNVSKCVLCAVQKCYKHLRFRRLNITEHVAASAASAMLVAGSLEGLCAAAAQTGGWLQHALPALHAHRCS